LCLGLTRLTPTKKFEQEKTEKTEKKRRKRKFAEDAQYLWIALQWLDENLR
jgi:hypothetical protein